MKVAHTGDIHVSPKHRKWVMLAFTSFVDTVIEDGCVMAVLAGDLFDSAIQVHEPVFAEFVSEIVRLATHMEVAAMYGTASHDRPGMLDFLGAIPTKFPLHVVSKPSQIMTAAGALVSFLPGINKAEPLVAEIGANAYTCGVLESFAKNNMDARANGVPTILAVHGTINGSTTEIKFALVSPDHEMNVESLAAADADAVFANHIHAHQSWPNVRTPSGSLTTIAYPGSLARLVHGHRDPVGFLIWDIEPGRACFTFHPSPARQLLEIAFDGPPDMDDLRALASQAGPDDAVRIRWEIDEEHAGSVDKALIRDLFAGCDSVKLEARVLPVQRVRAAGIGRAMTLADKLRYWAETTGSLPALERLTDRLALVQSMDPEQIVAKIEEQEAV